MTNRPAFPLFPILLVHFIGTLGFSIVLPFLVFLVKDFGGNAVIYGVMGATYSAFQLVGAPWLGNLSDRFGRRPVLLVSQGGTLLAWCLFLLALFLPENTLFAVEDSAWLGTFTFTLPLLLLFVARMLDGITGGNISVTQAYLADITPPERRKANYGKLAVAANLGFVIGPALAGLLGATPYEKRLPVLAALLISLVALALIQFRLPESHHLREAEEGDEKEVHLSFLAALKLPGVAFLLLLYFLIFAGFNFFYASFPVHAAETLQWSTLELGIYFSILGLLMAAVQGPLLNWLSDKVRDEVLMVLGGILLVGFFACQPWNLPWLTWGAIALFALGNGLMWPSYLSILSKQASDRYQGAVQGYASSMGSAASILGLVLGGWLYAQVGPQMFWISAGLFGLVVLLGSRWLR